MFSMPRHIVQLAHAFWTMPPSTSTSTRRWPSIRVTGSMLILVVITAHLYVGINALVILFQVVPLLDWRRQNRQTLYGQQKQNDAGRNEPKGNQNLDDRRRVVREAPRPIRKGCGIEAVRHSAQHDQHTANEQVILALAILLLHEKERRDEHELNLIPEQEAAEPRVEHQQELAAEEDVEQSYGDPRQNEVDDQLHEFVQDR